MTGELLVFVIFTDFFRKENPAFYLSCVLLHVPCSFCQSPPDKSCDWSSSVLLEYIQFPSSYSSSEC